MSQLMTEQVHQNNAENIQSEIDTVWIIIYWKQGSWKTLLSICLALDWKKRIYANFDIYKKWKLFNKRLKNVDEIQNIRFSYTPGVIIIDEAWINANSKDTRNEQNRVLQEILFLVRKLNCSLIWISQRFESIDINARVLSELIIKMKKIRRKNKPPIFIAVKQKQIWSNLNFVHEYKIDCIKLMESYKLTYNTLEKSKFIKKTKKLWKNENVIDVIK